MDDLYLYPNRTICSVLEDMRGMHKTHNYSQLASCIEEIQYAANRMEAALGYVSDIRKIRDKLAALKKEYRELDKKVKAKRPKKKKTDLT